MDKVVRVSANTAERLAYYASIAPGVLAPRGWTCHGGSGSDGESMLASPGPTVNDGKGAGVSVEHIRADAYGRFAVADIIAHVFPAEKAFVQAMIDAGDVPPGGFTFGPYPADRLLVQTNRLVQFETPPHAEGLGSGGYFMPNDDPIDGVAILQGQNPDVLMLRVRLPREQRDLVPVIIRDLLVRQRRDTR